MPFTFQSYSARDPRWDQWLQRASHDVFHTAAYHRVSESAGEGQALLAVVGRPERFLAWPYLRRDLGGGRFDVTSVYGYAGPVSNADAEFQRSAMLGMIDHWSRDGVVSVFCRVHPFAGGLTGPPLPEEMLAYQGQTVSICLTCSAEERWRHFKRQLRQHIAHGRERGFETVIDAQWRYAEDFFAIYASTMRRNRAPEFFFFSREYFARLRQELGEHAVLAVTRRGSEVASAGLIFDYQGLAHVHLAGTREDFLPQSPSKVMFADVAEWGASRGVRLLHLGGGRGGSDSDSLFRFKSEFSPLRHRFHTVRLVLDDRAYEALTAAHLTEVGMRRIDQTYFPQYRAPLAPEALNLP